MQILQWLIILSYQMKLSYSSSPYQHPASLYVGHLPMTAWLVRLQLLSPLSPPACNLPARRPRGSQPHLPVLPTYSGLRYGRQRLKNLLLLTRPRLVLRDFDPELMFDERRLVLQKLVLLARSLQCKVGFTEQLLLLQIIWVIYRLRTMRWWNGWTIDWQPGVHGFKSYALRCVFNVSQCSVSIRNCSFLQRLRTECMLTGKGAIVLYFYCVFNSCCINLRSMGN